MKIQKDNLTIALTVLYAKKEKIYPAHVSKHNSSWEKQVVLLMIPNEEGWHYITMKKLPLLLREITSKHQGNFYCLNCHHSFATEKHVNIMKKYVKIKIFVTL